MVKEQVTRSKVAEVFARAGITSGIKLETQDGWRIVTVKDLLTLTTSEQRASLKAALETRFPGERFSLC